MFERGARLLVPGIAVTAANIDIVLSQLIDQVERAGQLRRERHAFDHIRIFEQRRETFRSRVLNEFRTLRAGFCF